MIGVDRLIAALTAAANRGENSYGGRWEKKRPCWTERESLPSSLVRRRMGLLGGPSPSRVCASTCSTYTVYFWRASRRSDTLPSPSAVRTLGGPSESFSAYSTWTHADVNTSQIVLTDRKQASVSLSIHSWCIRLLIVCVNNNNQRVAPSVLLSVSSDQSKFINRSCIHTASLRKSK